METQTLPSVNNNEDLESKIEFLVLSADVFLAAEFCSLNYNSKSVWHGNALKNNDLAKSYCLLDKNAFGGSQPAPIFMKLDTLIMGGYPILMTLPIEETDPELVEDIEAHNLKLVPIGFMDLHYKGKSQFSVSGLGIAKQYQGKGLSKVLISAGCEIAGVKKLLIPTQLSNAKAHYAWLHLAPLEIVTANPFHNEPDTIVYKTKIGSKKPIILKNAMFLPFSEVKTYCMSHSNVNVVGYQEGENGGLYTDKGYDKTCRGRCR